MTNTTFRRGYNAALLAIRRTVGGWISGGGIRPEAMQALGNVTGTCRQLRQRARCAPRLATFATVYAISLRTVKNWKRAGCPFAEGKKAVLFWMFRRRTLPPGAREKFAREFRAMEFAESAKAAIDTGRGVSPATDDGTRLLLSRRISAAMRAGSELDGLQLLKRAAHVHALTKTAVRAGVWQ